MQATGGNADALVRAGGAAPPVDPNAEAGNFLPVLPVQAHVKFQGRVTPFAELPREVQAGDSWTVLKNSPHLQNGAWCMEHGVNFHMSTYDLAGLHSKKLPEQCKTVLVECVRDGDGHWVQAADFLCKMGVYTGEQAARQSLQKLEKALQMRTACTDPNCSGKGEHVLCPVTKGNLKMKPYLNRGNQSFVKNPGTNNLKLTPWLNMTGLFEVALKNIPALQDSVNQHEMASAGMLGEEAQAESFQDNLRRMDAGSNAQAAMGGITRSWENLLEDLPGMLSVVMDNAGKSFAVTMKEGMQELKEHVNSKFQEQDAKIEDQKDQLQEQKGQLEEQKDLLQEQDGRIDGINSKMQEDEVKRQEDKEMQDRKLAALSALLSCMDQKNTNGCNAVGEKMQQFGQAFSEGISNVRGDTQKDMQELAEAVSEGLSKLRNENEEYKKEIEALKRNHQEQLRAQDEKQAKINKNLEEFNERMKSLKRPAATSASNNRAGKQVKISDVIETQWMLNCNNGQTIKQLLEGLVQKLARKPGYIVKHRYGYFLRKAALGAVKGLYKEFYELLSEKAPRHPFLHVGGVPTLSFHSSVESSIQQLSNHMCEQLDLRNIYEHGPSVGAAPTAAASVQRRFPVLMGNALVEMSLASSSASSSTQQTASALSSMQYTGKGKESMSYMPFQEPMGSRAPVPVSATLVPTTTMPLSSVAGQAVAGQAVAGQAVAGQDVAGQAVVASSVPVAAVSAGQMGFQTPDNGAAACSSANTRRASLPAAPYQDGKSIYYDEEMKDVPGALVGDPEASAFYMVGDSYSSRDDKNGPRWPQGSSVFNAKVTQGQHGDPVSVLPSKNDGRWPVLVLPSKDDPSVLVLS